jgi:hypothetical protein
MENPNEYDDDEYARRSTEIHSVIDSLWEAGATLSNIESEIESALENATGSSFDVTITVQ